MNYEVTWLPRAEQSLVRIWQASRLKLLIAESARKLNREPAESGIHAGESRSVEGIRIIVVLPLVAEFLVDEEQRKVAVVRLRKI